MFVPLLSFVVSLVCILATVGLCPQPFTQLGIYHKCVIKVESLLSWNDARSNCQSKFANLLTISDVHENDQLFSQYNSSTLWKKSVWIGFNNLATNESYLWDDGSLVQYTNWAASQPDNAGNKENCAEYYFRELRQWNDLPCSALRASFCFISEPTAPPTLIPTFTPSFQPSRYPSSQPSSQPSKQPTKQPTNQPSAQPSSQPTQQPTLQPSRQPTSQPSRQPTLQPSRQPTLQPSRQPTSQPSRQPTSPPSRQPTLQPSRQPTSQPSRQPSIQPTSHPSNQPSCQPSRQPSNQPTLQPISQPSLQPSKQPTAIPSEQPSQQPLSLPTRQPSCQPTRQPTEKPSSFPTGQPSTQPTIKPSRQPSCQPSRQPSTHPSNQPTTHPSIQPIAIPSGQPSSVPSSQPTIQPSNAPTIEPTAHPSLQPTVNPSTKPTSQPSSQPSYTPTMHPSSQPTYEPSAIPTSQPSCHPSSQPSLRPTGQPSYQPTSIPSRQPSSIPTTQPSQVPSSIPSISPSNKPTLQPSAIPSAHPSNQPSNRPTAQPSIQPTQQPFHQPTKQPSSRPSSTPSRQPTSQPSSAPSLSLYTEITKASVLRVSSVKFICSSSHKLVVSMSNFAKTAFGPSPFLCNNLFFMSFFYGESSTSTRYLSGNAMCTWTSTSTVAIEVTKDVYDVLNVWKKGDYVSIYIRNSSNMVSLHNSVQTSFATYYLPMKIVPCIDSILKGYLQIDYVSQDSYLVIHYSFANIRQFTKFQGYLTLHSLNSSSPLVLQNISSSLTSIFQDYLSSNMSEVSPIFLPLTHAMRVQLRSLSQTVVVTASLQICRFGQICSFTNSSISLVSFGSKQYLPTVTLTKWNESCGLEDVLVASEIIFSNYSFVYFFRSHNLTYSWLLNSNGIWKEIESLSNDVSVFRMPSSRLTNQEAWLKLIVRVSPDNITAASLPVLLRCYHLPLIARLLPSQRQITISLGDRLLLNASTSYDAIFTSSSSNRPLISYFFAWSCRSFSVSTLNPSAVSLLSESSRERLALPKCMVNLTNVMTNQVFNATKVGSTFLYTDVSTTNVYVSAAFMEESMNTISELSVIMRDPLHPQRQTASETIEIIVSGNKISSSIRVLSQRTAVTKVNIENPVKIIALISSSETIPTTITGIWSWISAPVTSASSLLSMTMNNKTQFNIYTPLNDDIITSLILKPYVLSPGSYYLFRLSISKNCFAEVEVTTNTLPSGGTFHLSPTVGNALETSFSLAAINWYDTDEDYPLTYAFYRAQPTQSMYSKITFENWIPIPTFPHTWFINDILMPTGHKELNYLIFWQCKVTDYLGGMNVVFQNISVKPMQQHVVSGSKLVQIISSMVSNASVSLPPVKFQQLASTLLSMLYQTNNSSADCFSYLSMSNKIDIASLLTISLNITRINTDISLLSAWSNLSYSFARFIQEAKLIILETSSQQSVNMLLNTYNANASASFAISMIAQLNAISSTLGWSLMSAASTGSTVNFIQLSTEMVKLSLALLSPNAQQSLNSTTNLLLPAISLPDTTTTIAIASNQDNTGPVLVEIASFSSDFWFPIINASYSNRTGLPEPALISDIVSVKVSYPSNGTSTSIPSFVTSIQVQDTGEYIPLILHHNCSIGVISSESLLCPESLVLITVTCSGFAKAIVRRSCPVPERVCNVLSLTDMSITSDSYCHATQTIGSSVTCECGLDTTDSNNNVDDSTANSTSASTSLVLPPGSPVNVAVMTQYVAGNLGGTVIGSTKALDENIAEKSMMVFLSFGLLWGFGLLNMMLRTFDVNVTRMNPFISTKKESKAKQKANTTQNDDASPRKHNQIQPLHTITDTDTDTFANTVDTANQEAFQGWRQYLIEILPTVFHPIPWLQRLLIQMTLHHKYISLFTIIFDLFRKSTTTNNSLDMNEERKKKKSILQVGYMLTAITVSCFTLAVLYDIQYPADDGSCITHETEIQCLTRKTILDNRKSYCKWIPDDVVSAGLLTETRNGLIIQSLPLESVLHETSAIQCVFDDSDASSMVIMIAILISAMVTLPIDIALVYIFYYLAAKGANDLVLRAKAKEVLRTMVEIDTKKDNITPKSNTNLNNNASSMESALVRGKIHRRDAAVFRQSSATDVDARTTEITGISKISVTNNHPHDRSHSKLFVTCTQKVNSVLIQSMHQLQYIMQFSEITGMATASVPKNVHLARLRTLYAWTHLHEVYLTGISHQNNSDIYQNRIHSYPLIFQLTANKHMSTIDTNIHNSSHINLDYASTMNMEHSMNQSNLSDGDERRLKALKLQLQHATNEEFGMTLLQSLYIDILDPTTVKGDRFLHIVEKDFPSETYVSEKVQCILLVVVICVNVGALLFVILKGSSRGYGWQRSLLTVCFLDWFIEVIVHQTFEVYFVHFLLPNLIYEEVGQMFREVLLVVREAVHALMKCQGTLLIENMVMSEHSTVNNSNSRTSDNTNIKNNTNTKNNTCIENIENNSTVDHSLLVSQLVVLSSLPDKRALMESQLILFFTKICANVNHNITIDDKSKSVMGTYFTKFLFAVSGLWIGWQRVTAAVISSALFSAMSFLWLSMQALEGSGGIMAAVVICLVGLGSVVFLVMHRHSLLTYYQSLHFWPKQITKVQPLFYRHFVEEPATYQNSKNCNNFNDHGNNNCNNSEISDDLSLQWSFSFGSSNTEDSDDIKDFSDIYYVEDDSGSSHYVSEQSSEFDSDNDVFSDTSSASSFAPYDIDDTLL